MSVVPVVIAPQTSITLFRIRLNWWRPSKVKVILDEREESVVGDVQWGKLGRFPLSLRLLLGEILVLSPAPLCGPYQIHGPTRLAFKWKENVKRKCGLIFEFWKIHPQGGTVLLWSRHLLLFLFLSGENQVRTKKPQ